MLRNTVIAGILLLIASCSLDSDNGLQCLNGEGAVVSETRNFSGNFTSISHQFPGNLHITSGSFPAVTVEGQQNLLDVLNVQVANDILLVQFSECLESGMFFNVFVTVTELQAVSLEGLGNVIFENDIVSDELDLFLTGVGNYDIQGSADTLNISLAGEGNVTGFDFAADLCDIIIVGNGDVEITANTSLFVTINGQGNVFYKGSPVVLADINGLGTVNDAN